MIHKLLPSNQVHLQAMNQEVRTRGVSNDMIFMPSVTNISQLVSIMSINK